MPVEPLITLKATLMDLAGNGIPGGTLQIYLAGYGSQTPEVPGTDVFGANNILCTADSEGDISQPLFGNDVITPAGTFYCMVCSDANGDVVWAQDYVLTGSGDQDLSGQDPYNPPPPVPVGGRVVEVVSVGGVAMFDASLGSPISTLFHIVLTEHTTAVFPNLLPGVPYFMAIDQDNTGEWTFDWGEDVVGGMLVDPSPTGNSTQSFVGIANSEVVDRPSMIATSAGVYIGGN